MPGSESHSFKEEQAILVLSRFINESIVIDNRIEVVVVEVRGNKVSLGIKAPSGVTVYRKEVQDRIDREREGEQSE